MKEVWRSRASAEKGIHAALQRAQEAARGKDITLGGGADVAKQYLRAGLIDQMEIHIVPVLLGDGARLFDHTGESRAPLKEIMPFKKRMGWRFKWLPPSASLWLPL
jgi:dihydrofolate reductase